MEGARAVAAKGEKQARAPRGAKHGEETSLRGHSWRH
jgi:hypothetical protein